jgi:hypothetical protein
MFMVRLFQETLAIAAARINKVDAVMLANELCNRDTLTGVTTLNPGGNGSVLWEGNNSCDGGLYKMGNYYGSVLSGGAFINTGC